MQNKLSRYTINPIDQSIMNRNLIDLDFGVSVTDWNVTPKFIALTQEWMGNDYFPTQKDLYQAVYVK